MLKVAFFQFFPPTLWTPGGGEVQLHQTREALQRLGVEVELFDPWSPRRDYDVLHVFGSTYQLSDFVVTAGRVGMRVVVSPITYTVKPGWTWRLWRRVDPLLPVPTLYTYRRRIYEAADLLLPSSEAEARQLEAHFSVPRARMVVVPHGVEARFDGASPEPFVERFGLRDFVLMVGRISHHKGQVRLIRALQGTGLQVVFIGLPDPEDPGCVEEFQELSRRLQWVHYLGPIEHGSPLLPSAYAAARAHALPSRSECPGLVSLEAALAGTNVVAGRRGTIHEYLGEEAFYCDPESLPSIRRAVLEAVGAPLQEGLRRRVRERFTWDRVAQQLREVYEGLVKG